MRTIYALFCSFLVSLVLTGWWMRRWPGLAYGGIYLHGWSFNWAFLLCSGMCLVSFAILRRTA